MNRQILLACLLAVALVTPAAAGEPTRLTLDADHELDTEAKQATFERTGSATASLTAPEMDLTVAAEHETCDIDGFYSDVRNDFFCIDYGEEIDRTIRVYIPAEFWHPYLREGVEPVSGDAKATFEPVEDGQYTAVTVTVTEPGTYAWKVNSEASYFAGAKDRTLDNVEDITGVGAPETEEWQFIKPSELGGNQSAYVLRAPNGTDALIVEYRQPNDEWSRVPDEQKSYAPVYTETKSGVDDRVYVFSTTTDSPEIRYKTEPGRTDRLDSALREIGSIWTRTEEITGFDIPFVGSDT